MQLICGDINATAIGTVTHVQGQKLVGFGVQLYGIAVVLGPTPAQEGIRRWTRCWLVTT